MPVDLSGLTSITDFNVKRMNGATLVQDYGMFDGSSANSQSCISHCLHEDLQVGETLLFTSVSRKIVSLSDISERCRLLVKKEAAEARSAELTAQIAALP